VADNLVARIGDVLDGTPPAAREGDVGWAPDTAPAILELLASAVPVGKVERGPSYVLETVPGGPEGVECWVGGDADRDRLAGLMPEADRHALVEPWAVAVVDGRVAAVCETARSAPTSVEAGVWTYERYRRKGIGTAATRAWTRLVADRTIFYSASFDNLGSQGIARRLGMRPLGHLWHVGTGV
jgi:hypothetical protein